MCVLGVGLGLSILRSSGKTEEAVGAGVCSARGLLPGAQAVTAGPSVRLSQPPAHSPSLLGASPVTAGVSEVGTGCYCRAVCEALGPQPTVLAVTAGPSVRRSRPPAHSPAG